MHRPSWSILLAAVFLCASTGRAQAAVFEHPCAVLDAYDADGSCWGGMSASGSYPAPVVPEKWLVGPPPSTLSAVTLPTDHWVDLAFSGRIVGGDGNDVTLVETGRAGEQALLFITDGADQEYLLTRVVIENAMKQDLSHVGVDLDGVLLPFVPRAIRLVALDLGGQSPGFDLASVQARVSHDCGTKACSPNPVSGVTGIDPNTRLTWAPGYGAGRHVIYFGEVASQVTAAAAAVRYPAQPRDVNVFEPPALELGRTYYWRVDQVAATDVNVVQAGDVWSFTVADHRVVDNFDAYDLSEHFLYETWQTRGRAGLSLEQGVFRSCRQSISFRYQYDSVWSSEAARMFEQPQDWTRPGAKVLQLMLYGTAGNAANGRMYVAIGDGDREQMVTYSGDMGILADPQWHVWRIALTDFNSVNLANVRSIVVGLCPATTDSQERGTGTIYIDDITLYPAVCVGGVAPTNSFVGVAPNEANPPTAHGQTSLSVPPADLTDDCIVDHRDLERLAADWLDNRVREYAVSAPNEPILWYEFEGNADDRAGAAHGRIQGRCDFGTGVYGQAIHFANPGDVVTIPEAAGVFARVRDAITITFWQRGNDSPHLNDTVCCSNYVYGQSNPAIAIHLGCWRNPGQYRWDCGHPWSFDNRLAGRHRDKGEWASRWNHWAFTKDVRRGRMEIYLNGELYASRTGTDTPITGITSFEIGSGWYGHYDGMIDDFQIYDYALSAAEIAYVATDGTGIFPQRPASPADLNADEKVDLADFAILAAEWLQDGLWP